ncbi:FGGY-family carbohydrate kinase [Dongia deserti]|uniref:FGGY-family carbohydrate kinase n=1 Tax=Dongia deserti TaxID=2268030 RepID=UPI000E651534|nr:carbohydrate kinase [Dongia deserti]
MSTGDEQALAVFDLGKTNAKLLGFGDRTGKLLFEERTAQRTILADGLRVLDHQPLFEWLKATLASLSERHEIAGLMVSTHGCTFALTTGDELAAPILDYEQPVPSEIDRRFAGQAPDFAESFTPNLPGGLNVARHIYMREQMAPDMFRQADAILNYPQFWNWLFTRAKVSEISSIGCHSHLWNPRADTFSSLVERRGWRAKFPPLRRAGEILGEARIGSQSVPIHNGVHDSNAALYYYRSLGHSDVTLISTGTWVIVFNQACPLDALDASRDMLANVTVDRAPIATARFMGGREYEVITEGAQAVVSRESLQRVIDRGQFALPSLAPGGPFPSRAGALKGPEPSGAEERTAIATLYVALMMDVVLDQLRSANPIVVDGGLARNKTLLGTLAALRPAQRVSHNIAAEGTAMGAAALALEAHSKRQVFAPQIEEASALELKSLHEYRETWRNLCAQQ